MQRWRPRANMFCDFSTPPVQSTAPATKRWCQVIRSAAPVAQNHLSKPTDLMLQNATPLRKSAPGPPNSSDEHVSCTAPATRNASLQILFKCPTPAIVFGNATEPSRFADFEKVHNPLCLPRETTSERPKVVRSWGVLYILTSKCASRHNGVHFFDIATSKSAPMLKCFIHFDLEMCFAPQRRALFRHLKFQKWSRACAVKWRWSLSARPATCSKALNARSCAGEPDRSLDQTSNDKFRQRTKTNLLGTIASAFAILLSRGTRKRTVTTEVSSTADSSDRRRAGSQKMQRLSSRRSCAHGWQSEATDGPKGGWGLLSFSLFLSLSLAIYLPTYLSIYVSIYLSIDRSIDRSIYRSIDPSIYLPIYLSIHPSISVSLSLSSNYLSIYLST